ncbi:MAG: serine protease [Lachnospiraceae bacterium]|nr:serine protease [Lachnospiraceae bacterium]
MMYEQSDKLLYRRKRKPSYTVSAILASILLSVFLFPCQAIAKETYPPHLIQTVSDRDIYEGMLALELLKCPVLPEKNCEEAFEIVKNCVVRIQMGNAYGSGVIWEMTPENIVIATNKHVLEYWDEKVSYVHFPQGYFAQAEIFGVSSQYDVGFLKISNDEFTYRELEGLRYVCSDISAYENLQEGDAVFYVGAQEGETEGFFLGSIGDTKRYIEEFDEDMLYGYGYARAGMSGGGTFDARGNFIGMISGGTADSETASVPLGAILEAYEEIGKELSYEAD